MMGSDEVQVHPAFGAWLITQKDRGGFIGQLAASAAADRTFPRYGDVEAARKWLQASRASGDDWEALDDAETAWAWASEYQHAPLFIDEAVSGFRIERHQRRRRHHGGERVDLGAGRLFRDRDTTGAARLLLHVAEVQERMVEAIIMLWRMPDREKGWQRMMHRPASG